MAVKVYMEPGVVVGSAGHCRLMTKGVVLEGLLVRCAAGGDPKMLVTSTGAPATGDI